ncbi:MAG: hypothetical protein COX36_04620 [Candidatus Nealsonbacteria bacterium CG23_combo_of_CG06-09_8_20_14_all_38_19]|uniref:Uncharacterized protein n=1 Tax=Candidatus Nealsonbacteria bacterium CG23_combo_of_CG06-09_8_20_14_all_38_19 TaxID=1974721 RepID=A0A2G9YXL6_9BACT|nr:MAG: hypothetical protein COX36_04620 [Candidatus Nealsonbacteria bacterium CG23_combo_of_CG06-09_8_20_14_all_38_19]
MYSPVAKAIKTSFTLRNVFLSGSIVLNLGSLKYPSGAFAESSPRLIFCLMLRKMFSLKLSV